MKIYAIRDRLIDYYMQPFVGPDDKNVLASVARLVNQGEITSDIAQAPHQFEVWTLGEVQEDGTLVAKKEYIADCSSLVRGGIRRPGAGQPGADPTEAPGSGSQGTPGRPRAPGGANPGAVPNAAQAAPGAVEEVRGRFGRGYEG